MRAFSFCLPMVMAMTLVLGARAADDAKPAAPATPATPATPAAPATDAAAAPATPAVKDEGDKGGKKGKKDGGAFVGTLSEKPADAKEGVVAVLTTKKGDKHNLLASGEAATQIAELIKKGAKARVAGEQSPEGVKVTKVTESIPGEKKKKKDAQ